ncbi:MAG: hypothetical protein HUJ56_04940, partial [Erysipelotrichaceae bacterium]|nr:hypothetical protein [Erysipelotrichaceae bacterium]
MEEMVVEEVQEKKYKYVISIKFKNNSKPYSFGYDFEDIEYGDYVVVETARGMELGECVSPLRLYEQYPTPYPLKPVIRKADAVDRNQYEQNLIKAKDALAFCEEQVIELGLQMNLISAEYTLDRSKILFVYLADERVDFRELLKVLAQHLHCRIELKQIGARDKAKLVGGIGMCGRECCCSRFLNNFDVVSINMAKNQLLALNVSKLSGVCGKLMCCLKYEDAAYKELTKGLPKMNASIEYEGERYRVTSMNVISNQAKLENKETAIFITLDELLEKGIVKKGEPAKKEEIPEELRKLEDEAPKTEKVVRPQYR